ncbi:MAG: GspH/FimT family pseudopilin [Halioglobus sp.]
MSLLLTRNSVAHREQSATSVRPGAGFTLVELMIVLVLLAVLLGVAVPSFRDFITNQRLRATSNDLRIALMTARSEAVKRNRSMQVTPDGSWSAGWEILDPNDAVIFSHAQSSTGNVTIADPGSPVQFTSGGRASNAIEFDIQVGSGVGSAEGCLVLALDGRATFTDGEC